MTLISEWVMMHTWARVIERHGPDQLNNNDRRLLAHGLVISNTLCQHKRIHTTLWMHAWSKQEHMLDYIVTEQWMRAHGLDTKTYRGADLPTDQQLIYKMPLPFFNCDGGCPLPQWKNVRMCSADTTTTNHVVSPCTGLGDVSPRVPAACCRSTL